MNCIACEEKILYNESYISINVDKPVACHDRCFYDFKKAVIKNPLYFFGICKYNYKIKRETK